MQSTLVVVTNSQNTIILAEINIIFFSPPKFSTLSTQKLISFHTSCIYQGTLPTLLEISLCLRPAASSPDKQAPSHQVSNSLKSYLPLHVTCQGCIASLLHVLVHRLLSISPPVCTSTSHYLCLRG